MAVRNFYVKANIDGRETELAGGPRNKDGGMSITLYQRDKGAITEVIRINCFEEDGQLFTYVRIDGELVGGCKTER